MQHSQVNNQAPATQPIRGSRFFLLLFVPLAVVYLLTATWSPPYDVDTVTNALTAYEMATEGDVFLDEHEHLAARRFQGHVSWVVPARDTAASQYPPGAAVLAVPLYAAWSGDGTQWKKAVDGEEVILTVPPIAPAALTTALAVAAGVALLGLSIRPVTSDQLAIAAAFTVGLATGIWSVAADKLWLHTADVLYLSAGLFLSAHFYLAGGLSFGLAILTRPHTALIAAGTGLGRAWDARRWRPLLLIGAGAAAGLIALLVYNEAVFGTASISGGYRTGATDFVTASRVDLLPNLWGAMFDGNRGLFVYSPFLFILLPGIPAGWRAAPAWVRGAALGGLAYLLIQLASNRFSGGGGFWGYRYPIELIVAAAPLLVLSYREWVAPRRLANRLLVAAVVISIGIHAVGAVRCAQYLCR